MTKKLTENNFLQFALNNYDNPSCATLEEFEDDLKKFLYLNKLLQRYQKHGELRERLILNHVIVIFNLWGDEATDMLFHKVDEEHWSALIVFLTYLGRLPEYIPGTHTRATSLEHDNKIVEILREI
jgi:hypothetical protein|tara:strand:- start:17830 stop:18207 length:378 start_codon:yes stop_codon:yes gene_type:complete